MITPNEISDIRAEQEKFMPDRAIIRRKRPVTPSDEAEHTVATDVPCRVTPGFGAWRAIASRFQGVNFYTISFKVTQDVEAGDQIFVLDRVFDVRAVREVASWHTAKVTVAELIS